MKEDGEAERYLFDISIGNRTVSCLQPDGLTEKQKEKYLPEEKKLVEKITLGLENGLASLYIVDILRAVLEGKAYGTFTLRKATDTEPESLFLEVVCGKSTGYGG